MDSREAIRRHAAADALVALSERLMALAPSDSDCA
jgi:hypothetical protein